MSVSQSPDSQATAARLRGLRRDVIDMAQHSAHVAPALSCLDMLAALYLEVLRLEGPEEKRDHFVLSKGHGAMALYAVLAEKGIIPHHLLATYAQNGSLLAEHPLAGKLPGVEFALGTLGHGLAVAAGMAQGLKLRGSQGRAYVLLGDGECDEGEVWEAAAAASARGLNNLTALVDWNGWQACNQCQEVSGELHLPRVWASFGWRVIEVDGHDYQVLTQVLASAPTGPAPRAILARTVKGKGVDFMENNLEWHYRPVRDEERQAALAQLT